MIPEFKSLNAQEQNLMLNAPILVTLLIAGAEGNIEKKEIDWGAKIIHFKAEDKDAVLQNYCKEVDIIFNDTMDNFIKSLPENPEERGIKINSELKKINNILPKIDKKFASTFYKGLKVLAIQVAKAAGGIWGYGSVSPQEQKYIDLDVINPPAD